ncbi:MFS transporter [Pseudomonas typographi]|uniref:MFS transporter n=1 Tax=Pseudomonas typographi TaxID=2715964 RepID=A0ABR7YZX3_9PSED|nr:MFS transporter [Pseudomonas typographi]MBD1550585.1 MFS transporter [Pseudomonas typographi]MBD1586830.1 MFS transporter [Pseudomonas typographi]MBD1598724.1 MFS transporter [Pseudomonas typographi]
MSPSRAFLPGFMILTLLSGSTIGMAKIVTTLYAIDLGATPLQLGVIGAMESLGMLLLTLPAGVFIARYGARRVYFLASLGPMLLNLAIPLFSGWVWLAMFRLLIGLCIPFRMVAMSSAFLDRLRHIGNAKAGWYRAALTLGMGLLGPLLGSGLSAQVGFAGCFATIGMCFGAMAFSSLGFWRDAAPKPAAAGSASGASLWALLNDRVVSQSCLVEMLCGATHALFSTFIILLAITRAGVSQPWAASLLMVQGAALVVVLLGLGRAVQRLGTRSTYLFAMVSALAALLLLGLGSGYSVYALGAVLLSVAMALLHLLNMAQLGAQPMDKGRIGGLFNLAGLLGSCASALLGGAVAQRLGIANVFLAWIAPLVLAGGFGWLRHLRAAPGLQAMEH